MWPYLLLLVLAGCSWTLPQGTLSEQIAALAARHVHGHADGEPSVAEMDRIALERPVSTTCGYVSVWAVAHLREAGYDARVVDTLTLDEWNDTDNGHTLIEVKEDGRWVAYDIDQGVTFGGMSLAEWVSSVPSGDYQIIPLEGPVDEEAMRAWHRRIAQVPMIRDGDLTFFPSGEWDERVMSYDPSYTPITDWTDRFYPSAAAP